jgi:hypothetical protein
MAGLNDFLPERSHQVMALVLLFSVAHGNLSGVR